MVGCERRVTCPVKHIIGGNVQKRNPVPGAGTGHRSGGGPVDDGGSGLVRFGLVNRRPRGGVDDRIGV